MHGTQQPYISSTAHIHPLNIHSCWVGTGLSLAYHGQSATCHYRHAFKKPRQIWRYPPELPIDGYCTGAMPEAGRPDWEAGLAADWLEWAVLGVLWGEVWKALPAMRRMAASSGCSSRWEATSRSYSACNRRAISSSAVRPVQQACYTRQC